MKRVLFLPPLAALALAVAGAASANIYERIILTPLGGSKVTGTATLSPQGAGTRIVVTVAKAPKGATVVALLRAGDCKTHGASAIRVVSLKADARGAGKATGRALFRGEPVQFTDIADGAHSITLLVNGKAAACGVVPGMS